MRWHNSQRFKHWRSLASGLMFLPLAGLAQGTTSANPPPMANKMLKYMEVTARWAGFFPDNDPAKKKTFIQIIGIYFQGILGILGVVFLILIIFDGIKWMRAGGNEETITKAKTGLKNRAIGLTIILLARLITAVFLKFVEPVV